MTTPQPGILLPVPPQARYLSFSVKDVARAFICLNALRELADGEHTVVGLGHRLLRALEIRIEGLKPFPGISLPDQALEPAPEALWLWLRGDDRGELLHRSRALTRALSPAFSLVECVDAFMYGGGRDLSGFEDGTENPQDDNALAAAIVGADHRLAGSSFVATQRWTHDFDAFDALSETAQNHAVGRRRSDNEELEDAPESAHVKRTAQESFSPEAFVVRRSMPWAEGNNGGLMFVAFGKSFDAFEAQLKRMTGREDGVTDGLFQFTRPRYGAYYWCPPMQDDKLDFALLVA